MASRERLPPVSDNGSGLSAAPNVIHISGSSGPQLGLPDFPRQSLEAGMSSPKVQMILTLIWALLNDYGSSFEKEEQRTNVADQRGWFVLSRAPHRRR